MKLYKDELNVPVAPRSSVEKVAVVKSWDANRKFMCQGNKQEVCWEKDKVLYLKSK